METHRHRVPEIIGYALIKKGATTGVTGKADPISEFIGIPVRIVGHSGNGDVLVVNPKATAIATFDACDVESQFRCMVSEDLLLPPGLDAFNQLAYRTKLLLREGGYNETVRQLVIFNSLHSGKYDDAFLFLKKEGRCWRTGKK